MSNKIETGRLPFLLALAVLLATCGIAQATAAESTPDSTPSRRTSATTKATQKTSLLDATRVSTEEAAKSAAQKNANKTGDAKAVESSSDESVTELHLARPDSAQASNPVVTTSDESKKSGVKRVHGTVYGSAAAGTFGDRGGGAAVGATSKSGKTAVFVETDRSRRDSPH